MTNIDDIKLDGQDIAFVRNKSEVVFPEYAARENLKLWYDFSGRTNADAQKVVAEDLSGNGNNGTLNGFAYASGSGYQDGGLKLDGIDDKIFGDFSYDSTPFSLEFIYEHSSSKNYALGTFGGVAAVLINGVRLDFRYLDSDNNRIISSFPNIPFHDGINKLDIVYELVGGIPFLSIFINGELFERREITLIQKSNGYKCLLAWQQGGITFFYYFDKVFFSFRKYTKSLTASEISHNYAIDKKRFNITD